MYIYQALLLTILFTIPSCSLYTIIRCMLYNVCLTSILYTILSYVLYSVSGGWKMRQRGPSRSPRSGKPPLSTTRRPSRFASQTTSSPVPSGLQDDADLQDPDSLPSDPMQQVRLTNPDYNLGYSPHRSPDILAFCHTCCQAIAAGKQIVG